MRPQPVEDDLVVVKPGVFGGAVTAVGFVRRVGAGVEQHHLHVCALCVVERRITAVVERIDLRAVVEQVAHEGGVAGIGGDVQQRLAVGALCIDVAALRQQELRDGQAVPVAGVAIIAAELQGHRRDFRLAHPGVGIGQRRMVGPDGLHHRHMTGADSLAKGGVYGFLILQSTGIEQRLDHSRAVKADGVGQQGGLIRIALAVA